MVLDNNADLEELKAELAADEEDLLLMQMCSMTTVLVSEVRFLKDTERVIINMDETHHDLSITDDKEALVRLCITTLPSRDMPIGE